MARYILVEFDDNATAKAFVEKVNGQYGLPLDETRAFRVRAVWGKPTKFCDCIGARKGMFPYYRAEKSGWWVHSECGRPNKHWAKGNHWYSAIGRNLLPGNKDYIPGASNWGYSDPYAPEEHATIYETPSGDYPDFPAIEKAVKKTARRQANRTVNPRRT